MPAAAVIPAPIAYIKVVAVKKLVVGSRTRASGPPRGGHCSRAGRQASSYGLSCRWWRHPRAAVSAVGSLSLIFPVSLYLWTLAGALDCSAGGGQDVYFEKIRVLQAGAVCPNSVAWNNGIGPRFYFVGFSELEVMIKRDGRGHSYYGVRGEILGSP